MRASCSVKLQVAPGDSLYSSDWDWRVREQDPDDYAACAVITEQP